MASLQYDSLHESSPDVEKLLSYLVHFNGCFLHGSSDHLLSLLIMRSSWEALATLYAIEWLLSRMIPFMNRHLVWKSSRDYNGFFPSWTLWWYFKYVFGSWEALATLYAIEWLLSSVIPFMLLVLYIQKTAVLWYGCLSKACEERALLHTTQIRS